MRSPVLNFNAIGRYEWKPPRRVTVLRHSWRVALQGSMWNDLRIGRVFSQFALLHTRSAICGLGRRVGPMAPWQAEKRYIQPWELERGVFVQRRRDTTTLSGRVCRILSWRCRRRTFGVRLTAYRWVVSLASVSRSRRLAGSAWLRDLQMLRARVSNVCSCRTQRGCNGSAAGLACDPPKLESNPERGHAVANAYS